MVHHGPEGELVVALDVGADVGPVLARPFVLKWEERNIIWRPLLLMRHLSSLRESVNSSRN